MFVIDGKKLAAAERAALKTTIEEEGLHPHLAIILVDGFEPSRIYVRSKRKAATTVGIETSLHEFEADVREQDVLARIAQLNDDANVDGILVQLPLPAGVDTARVLAAISPDKDVDGLTPTSQGLLMAGTPRFTPCTPQGCLKLIQTIERDLSGKQAVIIGRSRIVGNPMAQVLLHQNCTVTITHSATRDLASETKRADIIVVAAGKANLLTADMVSPHAIVIDVGMNRIKADSVQKLVGDVDFAGVAPVVRAITPAPGGVGPMTVACLLANTVYAAQQRRRVK